MAGTDIRELAALDDLTPLVALYRKIWPDHYGPDGAGDAAADLAARCGQDGDLPLGLAALVDGRPVGAVALTTSSFGASAEEGPWLGGLAVDPAHRQRGLGSALAKATEALAKAQGYAAIYATTRAARGLFIRRGWASLRTVTDGQGQVWQVLSKRL